MNVVKQALIEASVGVGLGLVLGFLFGMGFGYIHWTQGQVDFYIEHGKRVARQNIDPINLSKCSQMLRDGTLAHQRQRNTCAYFIERAVEPMEKDDAGN